MDTVHFPSILLPPANTFQLPITEPQKINHAKYGLGIVKDIALPE